MRVFISYRKSTLRVGGGWRTKKVMGAKPHGVCISSIRAAGLLPACVRRACFYTIGASLYAQISNACRLSSKKMRLPAKMLDDAQTMLFL